MQVGDIVTIKTTGEKVYILAPEPNSCWMVRRPVSALEGIAAHEAVVFTEAELETTEDYSERKLQEYLIQIRAQHKLYKLETKMAKELEAADNLEARPVEPSVN